VEYNFKVIGMSKIAILIPTLNAGQEWNSLLSSIDYQNIDISVKVIIDSGSSDETIFAARAHNFTCIRIEKENFDHGYARQLLAEAAKDCDILIYLTQDCILSDNKSISNLVKAFEDPSVGIAYGRQLPRKGAKLLEAHARLFNYPKVSKVKSIQDIPDMGIKTASCSNSFAAYRREALDSVGGFPHNSIFGEDVIVGGQILLKGWKIAYVADASGYHSHDYSVVEEFKRYFDIGVFHRSNDWLLKEFGSASGEGVKYVKSEISTIAKNNPFLFPKMFASTLAKWIGYKLGLNYKSMPSKLNKSFSMHRSYWDKKANI
jgi:rhamnosyltransferase